MVQFDNFFFLWTWGIVLDFWKSNLEKGFVLFIGLEFGLVGGGVTFGAGDEDWIEGVQC